MKKILLLAAVWAGASWAQNIQVLSSEALPAAQLQDLAPAQKIDNKDLEGTMKMLGRQYRNLRKADSTAAMKEPAAIMAQYASQSEALGLNPSRQPSAEAQAAYQRMIRELRSQIASLEAAIAADDLAAAQRLIAEMGAKKDEGHDYFDVK